MDYAAETLDFKPSGRIDYLKFIFKTDAYEWQDRYAPGIQRIDTWLQQGGHKVAKITPLGQDDSGLRRYCVEWYGESAHHAAQMVNTNWYNCLYRVDYREEVPEIESADIQAVQAFVSVRPSGRTGTSTFSTPPAKKTHQRDVGGKGVRFGSRKSDQHGVLYKRGSERTAWEYRLQGRAALNLGREVAKDVTLQTGEQTAAWLLTLLHLRSCYFLQSMCGGSKPVQLMQWADEARAHMPSLFDGVDDGETALADAWWESLTEEQQLEWQRENFDTTPKGRKA